MKFDKIDVNKMEQQRYDNIKKKGEYIELDILIGTEKDDFGGRKGKLPVVTTTMKDCGPEEIACLYATLQNLCEHFEKEYPMECMLSKLAMEVQHVSTVQTKIDRKNEE